MIVSVMYNSTKRIFGGCFRICGLRLKMKLSFLWILVRQNSLSKLKQMNDELRFVGLLC